MAKLEEDASPLLQGFKLNCDEMCLSSQAV